MINKPPDIRIHKDYNGDPSIEALKMRGLVHHGSTLVNPAFTQGSLRRGLVGSPRVSVSHLKNPEPYLSRNPSSVYRGVL